MDFMNEKIIKRWNKVMIAVGCEHLSIPGEVTDPMLRVYYNVEEGISTQWMLKEARYWLSCYYEPSHCRHDDKFIDDYCYKIWVSETGMLKRLVAFLEKQGNQLVVTWEGR